MSEAVTPSTSADEVAPVVEPTADDAAAVVAASSPDAPASPTPAAEGDVVAAAAADDTEASPAGEPEAKVEVAGAGDPTSELDAYDAMDTRRRFTSLDLGTGPSRKSVTLGWDNINFSVKNKHILKGVNGVLSPGSLCAIMGPSGAGKSTLLNILAGRLTSGGGKKVSGTVTANGVQVDPFRFRKRIAYVMQEDALWATQTPREAINFSAALRLPATVTEEERHRLVEAMIVDLGLTKCADTLIGSIMIKGISGGEKKRTAIGVELISNPDILFLDEPTSGLDSFAAFQVVKILKRLSRSGRTVITTIHQPSSEVFDLFDDCLLLTDGRLIYHDRVDQVTKYFAGHGHVCPPHYNPADFVMFRMQQTTGDEVSALETAWADVVKGKEAEEGAPAAAAVSAKDLSKRERDAVIGKAQDKPGFGTQFTYLLQREARNVIRDKQSLGARIGTTIFLNLIVAACFYCAADWSTVEDPTNPAQVIGKINSQFGAIVQVAIGGMFGLAQPMLLAFPLERPVFLREYATGSYSVGAYFVSKLLVELPMMVFQSSLIFLACYWFVGFQANFFVLTLLIALLGLVSSSTALLISAIADNVEVAMQMTPLLFVPQLLFAGFFIPINEIPVFLRWAQYLCSLKYAINLVVLVEFDGGIPAEMAATPAGTAMYENALYGCSGADLVDGVCSDTSGPFYQNALIPRSEIIPDESGLYIGILLVVFCIFRILALLALRSKAQF